MCGHLGDRCRYDSYLADGHSEYFGQHGQRLVWPPVHGVLTVAENSQREAFFQHLHRQEQRPTTYLEMSMGLAQSGMEKWIGDTGRMTMTFYDKAGREMLVEQLSWVQSCQLKLTGLRGSKDGGSLEWNDVIFSKELLQQDC